MVLFRQGDVLLIEVDSVEGKKVGQGERVLALGELTGHSHKLSGDVIFFEKNGVVTARVGEKGAVLVHDEHGSHKIKKGNYKVVNQREYDLIEGVRRVTD